MSHLSVWFATLVIQSGAMAKFWPLHHSTTVTVNVWESIHLAPLSYLVGEEACQPDIFNNYS